MGFLPNEVILTWKYLAYCQSQPNMDYSDHRAWSCQSHILQRLHYTVASFLIAQWVLKVINSTGACMFTSSCRYCKSKYHSYWTPYHLLSLWSEKWLGWLTTSWDYIYVAGLWLLGGRMLPLGVLLHTGPHDWAVSSNPHLPLQD